MTTKHTPGPWSVTKAKHGVEMSQYVVAMVAPDRNDRALVVHAEQGDDAQGDANARLIATAPELLLEAMRYLNALDTWDGSNKADRHTKRMEMGLRAAIAKARGAQ
jgi:hypothetical protein